jgi:hypothetical protein
MLLFRYYYYSKIISEINELKKNWAGQMTRDRFCVGQCALANPHGCIVGQLIFDGNKVVRK